MRRIKLILEYDGTDFSGWQVQPDQRTVQGVLQESLSKMMGTRISIVGSGLTDAGGHALRQVAHANVTRDIPAVNILMGLNSDLPGDVRVLECEETSETFHAQRSATGKTYMYTILNAPRPTALDRYRVWHIRQPLDLEAMRRGADHLVGEHDRGAGGGGPGQADIRGHKTAARFEVQGKGARKSSAPGSDPRSGDILSDIFSVMSENPGWMQNFF